MILDLNHLLAGFLPKDMAFVYIKCLVRDMLRCCPTRAFILFIHIVNIGGRQSVGSLLWRQDLVVLTVMFVYVVADSEGFAFVILFS